MLGQVVIRTVCDAPQLAPSKREEEFYICGCFAVEGKFFFVMVAVAHLVFFETEG